MSLYDILGHMRALYSDTDSEVFDLASICQGLSEILDNNRTNTLPIKSLFFFYILQMHDIVRKEKNANRRRMGLQNLNDLKEGLNNMA